MWIQDQEISKKGFERFLRRKTKRLRNFSHLMRGIERTVTQAERTEQLRW